MDIKKLLQEHGPKLVEQLTGKAGFTPQQAQGFLPPLFNKVAELVKSSGLDLKALLGSADLSGLINKLGIGQIAKQVGLDEAKARMGATAIMPELLKVVEKAGLGTLLGGAKEAAGGILKKAGALFSGHPS